MNTPEPAFRFVFGPVPSRRLGRSLGVDLVPRKLCTFDCIYCQVGRTTTLTTARASHVPVEEVLREVGEKLRQGPRPDHITLAGSGESTLNADLETIIAGIKAITDVPVAVLTNGSLLFLPEVRRACARADVVLPTLDTADETTFRALHRHAPELSLEAMVAGMEAFRKEYAGQIWAEVFLVKGLNDSPDHLRRLAALLERVRPDRIQLNTAVRPTADVGVQAMTPEELERARALLGPKAEIVADFKREASDPAAGIRVEEVLDMIRRRPVTMEDIAAGLGIRMVEAAKCVAALRAEGRVIEETRAEKRFYRAV